jgi:hypothetical protein
MEGWWKEGAKEDREGKEEEEPGGGWKCRWETELVEKDFQFSPLYLFL